MAALAAELEKSAAPAPIRTRVSVLMSTYVREKAANLEASLESLWAQTELPDEIVLVVDGPVGADQESVLAAFGRRGGIDLVLVRLPANGGLAAAMNEGLAHCSGEYVMRMDSDDICQPDRVELQMAYARAHPEIDMICSWSEDFFEDGSLTQMKVVPVEHEAILRALRWRNVLQHSTVVVKASSLRAVEGYRSEYGLLEDYDLFVRLAQSGVRIHVIPKVLVSIRSSLEQRQRRGGWQYCLKEVRFRFDLFRSGFLSAREFILVTGLYTVFRLVSGGMRRRLYVLART